MIGRWGPHDVGGTAAANVGGASHQHLHTREHPPLHHDHTHHHHRHHHDDHDGSKTITLQDRQDRELSLWEKRVDAIENIIVGAGKPFNVHMLRRGIESIDPQTYAKARYYDRWTIAMTRLCVEKGIFTYAELQACFPHTPGEAQEATPPVLVGTRVRVVPSAGWHLLAPALCTNAHVRTPGYVLGQTGHIVRVCGEFDNPESEAYGLEGHKTTNYIVQFRQRDVWGPSYEGSDDDTLELELYHHWLQPVTDDREKGYRPEEEARTEHQTREDIERNAIASELPACAFELLADALMRVLIQKGIISAEEVQHHIDVMDSAGREMSAAKLVARAWKDPAFASKLLSDPVAACNEAGVDIGHTKLVVVPNDDKTHHLVVCTLCSCYPRKLLGVPPDWYKSLKYRSRAVSEPRQVLRESGLELPPDVALKVHDSIADCRYMVLPQPPAGCHPSSEEWTLRDLEALVTRDCCVGVAKPQLLDNGMPETIVSKHKEKGGAAETVNVPVVYAAHFNQPL